MPGKSKKTKKGSGKFKIVPFKKLKNHKAWKVTSELVRRSAKGRCYTCGRPVPYKKMVAGHSMEKIGHAAVYFDLDGLRGQCGYCNRRLHGNYSNYTFNLIKEIGIERVEALKKRARLTKQWTAYELEELWKDRKQQLEKLTNK